VESIRTTIYRQTLFAEFELAAHTAAEQGTPITADFLDDTYRRLIARYYGPGLTIDVNDAVEWAYIPHFYYNFYVFQYATSITASAQIAANMRADEALKKPVTKSRDAYLAMLSAGSSKYPIDLLKDAGVDMTTSGPFNAAIKEMNGIMDEMERLIAEKPKK
jgi:oligoendopeptidase F